MRSRATFQQADSSCSQNPVGECGLDYDRLHLCSKEVQLRNFPPQLELATRFDMPLFLHSRAAHADFIEIVRQHNASAKKPLRGVVHSHSESLEQAQECIELGFYIGIKYVSMNGLANIQSDAGRGKQRMLSKVRGESRMCQSAPACIVND